MVINVDFDGTCVVHNFPEVGETIPHCVKVLKLLVEQGHQLILFTMRSNMLTPTGGETSDIIPDTKGHFLNDAIKWFNDNDIPLYGIQKNPTQSTWTESPKSYAPIMIDDSALGCPLSVDEFYNDAGELVISKRPYVDWFRVESLLMTLKILKTWDKN